MAATSVPRRMTAGNLLGMMLGIPAIWILLSWLGGGAIIGIVGMLSSPIFWLFAILVLIYFFGKK